MNVVTLHSEIMTEVDGTVQETVAAVVVGASGKIHR
jgi:hypothetical protein